MKKLIFSLLLAVTALPAFAQVSISASDVEDALHRRYPAARLCFLPVDAHDTTVGFRSGSTQILALEVCGKITTGTLESGLHVLPNATGTGYHVYVKAYSSDKILRDFCSVPITGSTWTLDTLDCPTAGPIAGANYVTSVNGSTGSFSISGAGATCAPVTGGYSCTITGGSSAPSTSALLKGNGSGGIVAAVAGTDYLTGITAALVDAVGGITNSTSGNAGTATALAANGSNCTVAGEFAKGVDASGAAEGCATPAGGTSSNTWSRQGIVIAPGANEPSPQIQEVSAVMGAPEYAGYTALYSSVVKFAFTSGWYPSGSGGAGVQVCFGESPDGLTPPVRVGGCIADHARSWLMKVGSTYILYATNLSGGTLDMYTGSSLGGLTLAHSSVLSCGTNGSETSNSLGNVAVWQTGGSGANWRMLYDCADSAHGGSYADWLATSTDSGVTWTKASTTPKLGTTGASTTACYDYSGSYVYVQSSTNVVAYAHCGPSGLVPTPYIWRSTSTDNGVTFTMDASPTLQSLTTDEGVGSSNGQIADAFLLDGGALNKTTLFYSAYTNGCPNQAKCASMAYVKAATINQPLATVAGEVTSDGSPARDIPITQINGQIFSRNGLPSFSGPGVADAGNGTVVTNGSGDRFYRAAGALGTNWSGSANVVLGGPGVVQDTTAGSTQDFKWYSTQTFSASQCSYITVGALPTSTNWQAASIRETGTGDMYAVLVFNVTGGKVHLTPYKAVSGTFSTLSAGTDSTSSMAVGDVYGICAVGSTLTTYRNGQQIESLTDSTIAGPGYPGLGLPSNSVGGSISSWYSTGWVPSGIPSSAVTGGPPAAVTINASASASLAWTPSSNTCLSSSYADYGLRITDLVLSDPTAGLLLQYSTDGGSTWITSSSYSWSRIYIGVSQTLAMGSTGGSPTTITTGFVLLPSGGSSQAILNGYGVLFDPMASTGYKQFDWRMSVIGASNAVNHQDIFGSLSGGGSAVVATAIRVIPTSGTLTQGKATCTPLAE